MTLLHCALGKILRVVECCVTVDYSVQLYHSTLIAVYGYSYICYHLAI